MNGTPGWVSVSALIVSCLAFATALYSARTSARSLKQSGALVTVLLEASVVLDSNGDKRLRVHVTASNRGRADVDLYSLKFENWGRQFSKYVIPEETRRLKSYSRFDVDIDLTNDFVAGSPPSVWRMIRSIDELTVDLDLGSTEKPIQGLTAGFFKHFHSPLRKVLDRKPETHSKNPEEGYPSDSVSSEFTD